MQGSQVAFNWLAPRCGAPGLDTTSPILTVLIEMEAQTGQKPGYIIPDLNIGRGEPIGKNTEWVNRPMPAQKFNDILSAITTAIGCPPEIAKKLTGKSLRKNLPSGAAGLDFSPEAKQSIGNWQDVPESEGAARSTDKKPRAQFPMHMTYAEDDMLDYVAGHNKMRVIAAYAHTFRKEMSTSKIDMRSSGWRDLHNQRYTAEQLQEMISADAWTAKPLSKTIGAEAEPTSSKYTAEASPEKESPEKQTLCVDTDSVATSEDESESTDSSASSVAPFGDTDSIDSMPWFTQPAHGRTQLIHLVKD